MGNPAYGNEAYSDQGITDLPISDGRSNLLINGDADWVPGNVLATIEGGLAERGEAAQERRYFMVSIVDHLSGC